MPEGVLRPKYETRAASEEQHTERRVLHFSNLTSHFGEWHAHKDQAGVIQRDINFHRGIYRQ